MSLKRSVDAERIRAMPSALSASSLAAQANRGSHTNQVQCRVVAA